MQNKNDIGKNERNSAYEEYLRQQKEEEMYPLRKYSTSQLKAELRRRKKI